MNKYIFVLGISIFLTVLSGIRKSGEFSPYPIGASGGDTNFQLEYSQVEGGGFPLMWWRESPSLNPGEVSMTWVIRNGVGFTVDLIFWFGVTWLLYKALMSSRSVSSSKSIEPGR